jgi:hypothetical protein
MNVPLVFQLNQQHLNNNIPCNMHDVIKLYQVGDLIHYPGTCNAHNNFYARIDHITPKSMNFTVLDMITEGNNVKFYLTNHIYRNKTRRPFNLIDRINLY